MHLYETWAQAETDAQHERLDAQRGAFARFPMIGAMKAAVALKTDRKDWVHLRPPLVELDTQLQRQALALAASLDKVGFVMPNAAALA